MDCKIYNLFFSLILIVFIIKFVTFSLIFDILWCSQLFNKVQNIKFNLRRRVLIEYVTKLTYTSILSNTLLYLQSQKIV